MKILINVILMFVPCLIFSQFQDDFSDGDFTNNPTWFGNVDSFEVLNNSLHLNAPANTSKSYLVTNSLGAVSGEWEFYVEMHFNPSSGNKTEVYLMSDSSNLKGKLKGYLVIIGNTTREVSLYKQSNTSKTKIIDGIDNFVLLDSVKVKIKVTRDAFGNFELFADTSAALNNYVSQGSVFDDTHLSSSYFGILCDYTATRSTKFYFDDFNVTTQVFVDLEAPSLLNYTILNTKTIALNFSEDLDSTYSIQVNNYHLNGNVYPINANYQNQEAQILFSQNFLNNNNYTLQILAKDIAGNQLDTTVSFTINDNTPFQAAIINEIYADENPSFGMPDYEFLEIKNNTNDTLFMVDWQIANSTKSVPIPNDYLLANEYLILCKTAAFNDYSFYGKTIGVSSFPALKNNGDELKLLNKYGNIIDSVSYHISWYRNERDNLGNLKKDGGYSLERVKLNNPCSNFYNWIPSIDSLGATPGADNSIVNYVFPPTQIELIDVLIDNDSTLIINFKDEIPFVISQNCTVFNNEVQQVYSVSGTKQLYVLLKNKVEYSQTQTILFTNLIDCYGNNLPDFEKEFYRYEAPSVDDLVINELLFNPRTGGSDYIEIYNKSNKAILLEDFQILKYDVLYPNEIKDSVVIGKIAIGPKAYLVLSKDIDNIKHNYFVENPNWLHENKLPNFNDNEDIAVLRMPNNTTIDSLFYNKAWHFDLLDLQDGVSLERIDVNEAINNRNNWHSAAKTYGYGTPTAINSQVFKSNLERNISVEPEVFTPNEDGIDDFCLIQYKDGNIGELATVKVFDALGREIRVLAQNHSLGTLNTWKWDGTNNNFEKANVGIYIVLFEIFDLNGKTQRIKKKVVLGARLN